MNSLDFLNVSQQMLNDDYRPDYPETESVVVVSDILAIAAELDPPRRTTND